MSSRCVLLAALALCASCGAPDEWDSESLGEDEEELFVKSDTLWKSLTIPVCWENLGQSSSSDRDEVKLTVLNTWSAFSKVSFVGWNQCFLGASGIHIQVADLTPGIAKLGRLNDGVVNAMRLNFTWSATPCAHPFGVEACTQTAVIHEFGHALGFSHEMNRPDKPPQQGDCNLDGKGDMGNTEVGPYDAISVMNYCNTTTGLSSQDQIALSHFYGDPLASSRKKDAILWDSSFAYFFFHNRYVRYNVALDRMDDEYPKTISSAWGLGTWPATSTWTSGVSAVVDVGTTWNPDGHARLVFFSGNQYLQYFKTGPNTDKVEAGYPKTLPTGWTNWPSTWTGVDAAVRWPDGKIYLFRGSQYLRVSLLSRTVDPGYPLPIAGNWHNMPAAFTSNIDSVVTWPNGKAYFFKGNDYVRYNIGDGTPANPEGADPFYPAPIVGTWPGVAF